MFEKKRRIKELNALFSLLSDDGMHTSFIDEAAVRVSILPKVMADKDSPLSKSLRKMKQPILFDNKHICCEAAILSFILIDRTLMFRSDDYDKYFVFSPIMFHKLKSAINYLFGFSPSEIDSLYSKRCSFFEKILMESDDDLSSFIDEAVILFSHLFIENEFIDFSYNTPLLLLDPLAQISYKIQVSEYYKKIMAYIDTELLTRLNEAELK